MAISTTLIHPNAGSGIPETTKKAVTGARKPRTPVKKVCTDM
jgi:hypothetical protein